MTPKKSCENLHCVSPTDRMFTYMSRMSTSSLAFAFSCDRDCGEGAAHTAQRRPSAFSLAFAASSAARFTGSWCKMHIAQCPAVSHATEKYTHTHTYYIYICMPCMHPCRLFNNANSTRRVFWPPVSWIQSVRSLL